MHQVKEWRKQLVPLHFRLSITIVSLLTIKLAVSGDATFAHYTTFAQWAIKSSMGDRDAKKLHNTLFHTYTAI
eukprot:scaffold29678_cov94-Skeletonema_dohrnii-CCMP3373.AAC.1